MAKEDGLGHEGGPEDHSNMADEYPSPEASNSHLADAMDMSSQLVNQAAAQAEAQAQAQAQALASSHSPDQDVSEVPHHTHIPQPQHHPPSSSSIPQNRFKPLTTSSEQIRLLREYYARNPHPSRRDLEVLAERTGRPYNKVREYFRQRRNKLRGLDELESMEEPGRASGWLKVTYRAGPPSAQVSQLSLYSAYKTRFDPYSSNSPLLGGQDLIELVCATFPGCDMSKAGEEYYLSGLKEKEGGDNDWEKTLEGVAEPVRASTWLLSNFQQSNDASPMPQTDLYTSYVLRFSAPPTTEDSPTPEQSTTVNSLQQAEGQFDLSNLDDHNQTEQDPETAPSPVVSRRLLNPVEMITLTRMTFPQCEPVVDEDGKFVIRGIERRDGVEKGWIDKSGEMFPFALMSEPRPHDPEHPFTNLLKRKLSSLHPGPNDPSEKKPRSNVISNRQTLGPEDKELLDGLRRFKDSDLGKEVKDICVNQ